MLLPKHVIENIDYYECGYKYSALTPDYDYVTVYWKKYFWFHKKTFKFDRVCTGYSNDHLTSYHACSHQYIELCNQLEELVKETYK